MHDNPVMMQRPSDKIKPVQWIVSILSKSVSTKSIGVKDGGSTVVFEKSTVSEALTTCPKGQVGT